MVMTTGFCASQTLLLVIAVGVMVVTAGIHTAYAATQTAPTEDGTLDVRLEYADVILPGEETKIRVDFLNPLTGGLQEHIDYTISVSQADERVFGPTSLIHTSPGTITVPMQFQREGAYTMEFSVQGILFNPIPIELVSFDIRVAGEGADGIQDPGRAPDAVIPAWIKTSAGWWASGDIDDATFIRSLEYLIQNGILVVPDAGGDPDPQQTRAASSEIPAWIRINAGWWAGGEIDDDTFVAALQYLIVAGVLRI